MQILFLGKQFLTIHKTFARCHLDFTDVICDNPFNYSFKEKLGKVQYSATLTIMGAIKGISRLLGNVCIKNLVLNLIAIKVVP